jgi:hypothetical protein
MPSLNLPRELVAQIAGGNALAIRQLETVFKQVGDTFPSTIEEANALAGSALAVAQAATSALALLADTLTRLEAAPVAPPQVDADDTTPRPHLGTIAAQNADAVEITGGTASLSTIAASGQITSTVATGTAPLVIASTTRVANLNVAAAGTADGLSSPTSYNAAATDLPTVIALANQLRAAAISKGL